MRITSKVIDPLAKAIGWNTPALPLSPVRSEFLHSVVEQLHIDAKRSGWSRKTYDQCSALEFVLDVRKEWEN